MRVAWRWTIPLHIDKPRRRTIISDSKSLPQGRGDFARSVVFVLKLFFFSLEINIPMNGHLGFFLVFKESIVQNLVINVDFAQFRVHSFPEFLLHNSCSIGHRKRVS